MGSRSKRSLKIKRKSEYPRRAGTFIFDDEGEKIGLISTFGTIWMKGSMPEAVLNAMVGRRLSEVIVRPDLCRDVRITVAKNFPGPRDAWIIETAGYPILPGKIAAKRMKEAKRLKEREAA